jgi:hypothetical protein
MLSAIRTTSDVVSLGHRKQQEQDFIRRNQPAGGLDPMRSPADGVAV